MSLAEISDAVSIIQNEAHEDSNIIFGAVIDEEMGEAVNVTVIATGFGKSESQSKTDEATAAAIRPVLAPPEDNKVEKPVARTVVPGQPQSVHVPAFIRRSQREKNCRHLGVVDDYATEHEEDLDIPTFLRKHAD